MFIVRGSSSQPRQPRLPACLPHAPPMPQPTRAPTAPGPHRHTPRPFFIFLQGWKGMGVVVASNYPNLLKLNTELQYGPDGYASSSVHTGIGFNRQAPLCFLPCLVFLSIPLFLFFAPEGKFGEDPGGAMAPPTLHLFQLLSHD
jgi:hypothetical protein